MVVYGRNTVLQGIESKYQTKAIFLEENLRIDKKIEELLLAAKKNNIPVKNASRQTLNKLTESVEHQGVASEIAFHEQKISDITISELKERSVLYISEATFEHNVGAIIRTAECLGMGAIIIPSSINITPTIAKISTGALFHIPIIKLQIFQAIKTFKDEGFRIVGIERDGKQYFNEDIGEDTFFIIGGEDKSLTENIRERCDTIVEIPQFGHSNSLNMSVAAGIIMSEHKRQMLSAKNTN